MTTNELRIIFNATRSALDEIDATLRARNVDATTAAMIISQQQTLIRSMLRAGEALTERLDEFEERMNRLTATMRARRAAPLN